MSPVQTPSNRPSDADCWKSVQQRNAAADNLFVYSVKTTGVYCRPSCPARRALRQNVAFHASCADAEAQGYRPCKRCHPATTSLAERHAQLVALAARQIEEADTQPTLSELSSAAGLSRYHFQRVFKKETGLTPKQYAAAYRGQQLRVGLNSTQSITQTVYNSGYNASSQFYRDAKKRLGMKPGDYRNGGQQQVIRFAVGECSLGTILVAATKLGACAIEFGEDPDALVRGLQDRFPKAELIGADANFEALVARVVGLVETPANEPDIPLDVHGTAFQEKVWMALQKIPCGSTASYSDIAKAIGEPKAARAVALACAANPAAVAIPCHRVVRSDGTLSGYRWGVERKRTLLEREAVLS